MIDLNFGKPLVAAGDQGRTYRLACKEVRANIALEELIAFESSLGGPSQGETTGLSSALVGRGAKQGFETEEAGHVGRRQIYEGPGWIGNRWRQVRCSVDVDGYHLHVDQVGRFSVDSGGRRVAHLGREEKATKASIVETMLGPGLILALTMNGAWCWHASAVALNGQAIVFLGESGSGKSTIAACLGGLEEPAWLQAADDVLPLAYAGRQLVVMPHFPQLKVPPARQPGATLPEQLPLRAIYILGPADGLDPQLAPLDDQTATLALVRHTVAALLFDEALLAAHLAFCARVASEVVVKRLGYPRTLDSLPFVSEAILADVG